MKLTQQLKVLRDIPITFDLSAIVLMVMMISFAFVESMANGLWTMLGIGTVLTCVLLHEFGHIWVAVRNGVGCSGIVVHALGAMAFLNSVTMPSPKVEAKMAFAGPLVNFILVALAFSFHIILVYMGITVYGPYISWFIIANMILGLFNLIPAFPLDGGRIFRAFMWQVTKSYRLATEIAVRVGQFNGVILALFGLLSYQFMLTFIGLFVIWLAQKELEAVNRRYNFGG